MNEESKEDLNEVEAHTQDSSPEAGQPTDRAGGQPGQDAEDDEVQAHGWKPNAPREFGRFG